MTTTMQPFQCDLQPQIQETHRTTHAWTTTRCRTPRDNRFVDETSAAAPAAPTQGTLHRRLQPLHTEKHTVSCSGFLPNTSPMQSHAAIIMRFEATRGKPACTYAHGNTRWQQSCSHSNGICNHRFNKRIELRTHEQPRVAEHQEITDSLMKRAQPHPPHTHGTLHRRLQPLHTEKHTVSCSGFLPNTSPMQSHAAIIMHFEATRGKPACTYAHGNTRWQQSCSHSNGICNHRFNKRIELRTLNNHHVLLNTKGEPTRRWNALSRTRRTHKVPFIAGCSLFTRNKWKTHPCVHFHYEMAWPMFHSRGIFLTKGGIL